MTTQKVWFIMGGPFMSIFTASKFCTGGLDGIDNARSGAIRHYHDHGRTGAFRTKPRT